MTRTADPKQRNTILQAARAVFHQKGYADARMTDIAARAKVAVGTIYLYFWTKEALVIALVDELHQRLLQEAIPLLGQGEFAPAIANTVHTALKIMYEQRDLLVLLALQRGLTALTERSAGEVKVSQALAAALHERQHSAAVRPYDPEKTALLILGLLEQTAMTKVIENEASFGLHTATVVRFIQHALIPDPNLPE